MGAVAILDPSGAPVPSAEIEAIRARAMLGDGIGRTLGDYEAPYHASSLLSQDTAAWRPPMRSGDFGGLIRRDLTIARIHDIVRNDPHAGAALDKLVDQIVGPYLRLSAKPDAAALGVDAKAARALGKQMQAEWRLFADDPRRFCDAQRKLSFNGLARLLARTWLTQGEATYALTLARDPSARYATAVLTFDPDRLCNPYGQRDTLTRRAGVEMDEDGAPIGGWVRDAHLGDYWAPAEQMNWTFVPRFNEWGRPVFVHGFEPQRDGDTRGTSPMISLITRLRMLGKFADNELASATINALMAATIESDLPVEEIAQRLTPTKDIASDRKSWFGFALDWYEKHPARLGGARIPVMLPGSKLTMNASPRQTTAFNTFETAFLQTIASRLGLSYEQLKGDWSKTNYSSARAALNEVWRSIRRMSAVFVEQLIQPVHLAWADEAFDKGYLKQPAGAPDFWDMPGAYLRCRWIGPGRGYVDPVKEAEASALRMETMISTLEIECADQGFDYEEILDQIAIEEQDLKDRGLTRLSLVAAVQSTRGPKPDSEEAQGPAGPGGDFPEGGLK